MFGGSNRGARLNPPWDAGKLCYEFRSAALVSGTLAKAGRFVPVAGGRVIRFAEYGYRRGLSPPICNLPGYFGEVKPSAEKPAKP